MEIIIQDSAEKACRLTARIIATALRRKPQLVLGLATGKTMERVYDQLADMHRQDDLDFALCRTFNLDEYIGLSPDDEHSYHHFMRTRLFDRINIDLRNTHFPDTMAADHRAACAHYEQEIKDCGGVDLQLLGIGTDGHIGFNEPLSALQSRTRDKSLTPVTIKQNAPYFGNDESRVPKRAITMGVGTILDSKRCLGLVTGARKASILAKAVEGPISSMVTASALQLHPRCTIVVDEEAAAELAGTEYYRWIFETEAEWQAYQD